MHNVQTRTISDEESCQIEVLCGLALVAAGGAVTTKVYSSVAKDGPWPKSPSRHLLSFHERVLVPFRTYSASLFHILRFTVGDLSRSKLDFLPIHKFVGSQFFSFP
jgi:hypothetical protein